MTPLARAEVTVTGRVQGVGFRWATREQAENLGLAGWVRNLPDGSVEAAFEGPRERVVAMILWCRKGPPSAQVVDVRVAWTEPVGECRFRIDHGPDIVVP